MRKWALLASVLIFVGCNEGSFWSGSLVAHAPMAILDADGQTTMEIAAGSNLSAALYREPDRSWVFEFRNIDEQNSAAITVPLQTSGLQYGRVYHLGDFGQNFEASVVARLEQKNQKTRTRTESCHGTSYVCGYSWKNGEYRYSCDHKYLPGRQTVQYMSYEELEVIEGEFFNLEGRLIGEFELTRNLGLQEKSVSKGKCVPDGHF